MPTEARMFASETELRRMAHSGIEEGRLVCDRPECTWGGHGNGALCELCGKPIGAQEIEYEVQIARDGGRTRHFHLACHFAWRSECAHREGC